MSSPANPESGLHIFTVSELTRRVKGLLEAEVGQVWVAGEISNWRVSPAGHAYFTLKDGQSELSGVMFRGKLGRVAFEPAGGLEVVAFGLVSVYERRGTYQIICDQLHPKGLGRLQLAFEQLKEKLHKEGLFDTAHKKRLPLLPRRIGIVTSPTGAAIRDILRVIERRYANVHIVVYPASVQGERAASELVAGLEALDRYGVDVIIIGRGGGSLEDLWPFNEEAVVRAVFATRTPVVSAVGHEIDFALTDFAADVRAATPSQAAELVVQEHAALAERVNRAGRHLAAGLRNRLERAQHRLRDLYRSVVFQRPEELLRNRRQTADDLRLRLEAANADALALRRRRVENAGRSLALLSPRNQVRRAHDRLLALEPRLAQGGRHATERGRVRLQGLGRQLHALSPLAVLGRGYALAQKLPEKSVVRRAADVAPGDELLIQFGEGAARAEIRGIEESDGKTEF